MSSESDYQKLLALKGKLENLEAARRSVSSAQSAITEREAKVRQTNVAQPTAPSQPKRDNSKSTDYEHRHRGSLEKAHKKRVWAVVILFSIGLIVLAVVGYQYALQNYANVQTEFGNWVLKKAGAPSTAMRVFTYIGAALFAIGNIIIFASNDDI